MKKKEIITKAEDYAREVFEAHVNDSFAYHNLEHTQMVVKATEKIAAHYHLDDQDLDAVLLAAWFHDIGYLFVDVHEHEKKSADLATLFLEEENASHVLIQKVRECILSTKIFTQPTSLIGKIVADADLFHLGTAEFKKTNKKMWVEMKRCFGVKIPTKKWFKGALDLLEKHEFHTEYCQNLLEEGKQENIDFLREWIQKHAAKCSNEADQKE